MSLFDDAHEMAAKMAAGGPWAVRKWGTIQASYNIVNDSGVSANQLGAVASPFVVVPDGETYTVLAANSGKTHIIPDLTADCVFSLPTAASNLYYRFIYGGVAADAHDWQFDAGSDTNFFKGGIVQHDPDDAGDDTEVYYPDGDSNSIVNLLTPGAGTSFELFCDGTNWYMNGVLISATDIGVTFADQS